jgi:hypothetical protein
MVFFSCIYISSLAGGRMYRAHPSTCQTAYINAGKTYHKKTARTNGLPGDEHVMFEPCIRQQELY